MLISIFTSHLKKPLVCATKIKIYVSFFGTRSRRLQKTLLEKLTNAILDDGGSIIVYHKSFEKTRLQELSLLFPEYSLQIQNIITRIFDLKDLLKAAKLFIKT
ncbi:DUF2779 domain-containing protein [Areca yellow leaf disease phytoplasma]|uniref:DUF2779 domain-containing protein n=1 Tax=Areca yellow leaf disease phytoplasma TaxID=927614 RepID=UPI0035B56862